MTSGFAQGVCDLQSSSQQCLDAQSLDGKTLVVPRNTTRLFTSQVKLCSPIGNQQFGPDLVYVLAQSVKSRPWAFWVPKGGPDTVFLANVGGRCEQYARNTNGGQLGWNKKAFRWRQILDPKLGWQLDSLYEVPISSQYDSNQVYQNCQDATDPRADAGEAIRAAMRSQAGRDSQSMAGFIGVSDLIRGSAPLRTLDASGLKTLLDSSGLIKPNAVVLTPAVRQAATWLKAGRTARTKGIVLMADERPSDNVSALIADSALLPPVHVIQYGLKTSNSTDLQKLSRATKGTFHVVPRGNQDSLIRALDRISREGSTAITAELVAFNHDRGLSSRYSSQTVESDASQVLHQDSILPLRDGSNRISLVSTWAGGEIRRTDSVSFEVVTSGPVAPSDTSIPIGAALQAHCRSASRLEILDPQGNILPYIPPSLSSFSVRLTTSGPLPSSVRLPLETSRDTLLAALGVGKGGASMVSPPMPLDFVSPASRNGTLELRSSGDTVSVSWCASRDERDCAHLSRLVQAIRKPVDVDHGSRCDLATSKSPTTKQCLDVGNLDGKTFTVPSNLTRIGTKGLTLCAPAAAPPPPTDIVYIIDQSGSMTSRYFWVDPLTNDTSYFATEPRALGFDLDTTPLIDSVRLRHYTLATGNVDRWESFRLIPPDFPRDVLLGQGPAGSLTPRLAGDPFGIRGIAVQDAIRFQAQANPASFAGVIGFHTSLSMQAPLRALNGDGLVRLLDSTGITESGGTNWAPPLQLAGQWLLPRISSGRKQAVIFISDGQPEDDISNALQAVRQPGYPPVYGIFLGPSNADIKKLDTLAKVTNGVAVIVPPNRPDSLQGVINRIVESTVLRIRPQEVHLRNVTTGQSSRVFRSQGNQQSNWDLTLDSVLALRSGANQLQLIVRWMNPDSSTLKIDTSDFRVQFAADSLGIGDAPISASPFDAQCRERPGLVFLDSLTRPVPFLTGNNEAYVLQLSDSLAQDFPRTLSIRSSRDQEALRIAIADSLMIGGWGGVGRVNATTGTARNFDGLSEVRSGRDTLQASWCNPRDPRDCAYGSIEVRSEQTASLVFVPAFLVGPRGVLRLQARLPGSSADTFFVSLWRNGSSLGIVALHRSAGDLFERSMPFAQSARRPSGDSLWLQDPLALDLLEARLWWAATGDTIRASAEIRKPALALDLREGSGAFVAQVRLQGGSADSNGQRKVVLSNGSQSILLALEELDTGSVSVLSLLMNSAGGRVSIRASFLDPVYRDSVWDTTSFVVPGRLLAFVERTVQGPEGQFTLEVFDPLNRSDTLSTWLVHRGDTTRVLLNRQVDGLFRTTMTFSQFPSGKSVDLRLVPPRSPVDSLFAVLPAAGGSPSLRDSLSILRRWNSLSIHTSKGPQVQVDLVSWTSRKVLLAGPGFSFEMELDSIETVKSQGIRNLEKLLPESRDSHLVVARFIDPVFGDTVSDSTMVPAPWFPSTLKATPQQLDPRASQRVLLEVTDRDPDSTKRDTARVVAGDRTFFLLETSSNSGIFQTEVSSQEIDPNWSRRPPRTSWIVDISYRDARNPLDLSTTSVSLRFDVPRADFQVVGPLVSTSETVGSGGDAIQVVAKSTFEQGEQGIAFRIWEPCEASVFIYDNQGTFVVGWSGRLELPENNQESFQFVRWNGTSASGTPAASGVYPVRVILRGMDGTFLRNTILRIGRKSDP